MKTWWWNFRFNLGWRILPGRYKRVTCTQTKEELFGAAEHG